MASQQPIDPPLKGHSDHVSTVAFSPDGKTLASGSSDNTIILWDVASGRPIGQPLRGYNSSIYSVAFSPDGKTLASGSGDNTIILWDVASQQPIGQPLRGHDSSIYSVAFSPDGKTLASGSADYTVILWDVSTAFNTSVAHASGQPIGQPLQSHSDHVSTVAFSPDGKTLASGSSDDTIILWDVASRQPIGQPFSHRDAVNSVAFSPDGKTLASGGDDDTIILWDVNPASWVEKSCQRVGRNFTHAEWAIYLPDKPYPTKQEDATCPQWPLEPEATPAASPTP